MKSYFQKPKGAIIKDLLYWIAVAGMVVIAATSPYFMRDLLRGWERSKRYKQKSVEAAFYRLRKEGIIRIERKKHKYVLSLTENGKQKAGRLQIDFFKIARPTQWDRQWRILMFDVRQIQRWKRDILRSFLRRLGFIQFQKSVWIHPFDCKHEVQILQKLLELDSNEVKLIIAIDIGEEEAYLCRRFKI